MADVFISYKRSERARVERIAKALQELGLSVWFDASLEGGASFSAQINREVRAAKAVMVCWTPSAAHSEWVIGEADIGRTRGVLAPVFLASADLPPPFNTIHAFDLKSWAGDHGDSQWLATLDRIGALTGRNGLRHVAMALAAGEAVREKGANAAESVAPQPKAKAPHEREKSPATPATRWNAFALSLLPLCALIALFVMIPPNDLAVDVLLGTLLSLGAGFAGAWGRPAPSPPPRVMLGSAVLSAIAGYGLKTCAIGVAIGMGPSALGGGGSLGAGLTWLGGAYIFAAALPKPDADSAWRLSLSRTGVFALLGLAFGLLLTMQNVKEWYAFTALGIFISLLGARMVLAHWGAALLAAIAAEGLGTLFWLGPGTLIDYGQDSLYGLSVCFIATATSFSFGLLVAFVALRSPWLADRLAPKA